MLKQYIRLPWDDTILPWDKKNTPKTIAAMVSTQDGVYSGVSYNDILNKRYEKHEIQNIVNGGMVGSVPINIDLLISGQVVNSMTLWLTTKEEL